MRKAAEAKGHPEKVVRRRSRVDVRSSIEGPDGGPKYNHETADRDG